MVCIYKLPTVEYTDSTCNQFLLSSQNIVVSIAYGQFSYPLIHMCAINNHNTTIYSILIHSSNLCPLPFIKCCLALISLIGDLDFQYQFLSCFIVCGISFFHNIMYFDFIKIYNKGKLPVLYTYLVVDSKFKKSILNIPLSYLCSALKSHQSKCMQ